MKDPLDYVEMKIPSKPEYVGVIRLTVSGISSRMGFSYEEIEDIKIAVSEATTNAIHHAYREKENGVVTLGFGVFENRLEVMVADSGKSFDAKDIREKAGPYDKALPVDELPESGLGLFLIETLMDKLVIHNDSGSVVFMTKFIERDGVEDNADKISTSETR
jgi:serine/threonine-protein kinase RsbW